MSFLANLIKWKVPRTSTDASGNTVLVGADGTRPLMLLPSGGDDGPAIKAMCEANRGLVLLGPGVFKVNSYTLLTSSIFHSTNSTVMGPQLIGCGPGVTVIDTSEFSSPTYTKVAITSVSASSSPVFTLATGEGSKVANGDIVRLEVISGGMLQANQQDFLVGGLSGDTFTAVAYNNTTSGLSAWTTSTHNYAKKYDATSLPVFRITPPISSGVARYAQQHQVRVEGISFKGMSTWDNSVKRYTRLFALETDEAENTAGGNTLDTRITHQAIFRNVQAAGYECVVHCDDVTNFTMDNRDMKGNAAVVWGGYNCDIFSFFQTTFGGDFSNFALGAGFIRTPWAWGTNIVVANAMFFDSCWFLGCEIPASETSNPITFKNCYFEQIRKLGDLGNGGSASFEGCNFSSFTDTGYVRPAITAHGSTVKQRISFRDCNGPTSSGPVYGYFEMLPNTTRERYWPTCIWENNSIGYTSGKGQFRVDGQFMAIDDGHDAGGGSYGDQKEGSGQYLFEGPVQTNGNERFQVIASAASITPNFLAGTSIWIDGLATNTTINALSNQPALSAAWALRRMLPLRFIIKQDATGGRTVTWNAIFKFHTAWTDAVVTTDASKTTEVEFRWDGSAWRQSSPANVWL